MLVARRCAFAPRCDGLLWLYRLDFLAGIRMNLDQRAGHTGPQEHQRVDR